MTQTAVIYGGSLYDLAAEEQMTDVIMEQMQTMQGIFRENPDYLKLLSEPSIPVDDRKKLLDEALGDGAEKYLINFLKLLCDKNLLNQFSGCCEEFTKRYNADNNIAEAVVTSAFPLTEEQQKALTEKLIQISGKKITLKLKTDSTVVAGLIVELDGVRMDGTVKGRLTGISRKLNDTVL